MLARPYSPCFRACTKWMTILAPDILGLRKHLCSLTPNQTKFPFQIKLKSLLENLTPFLKTLFLGNKCGTSVFSVGCCQKWCLPFEGQMGRKPVWPGVPGVRVKQLQLRQNHEGRYTAISLDGESRLTSPTQSDAPEKLLLHRCSLSGDRGPAF